MACSGPYLLIINIGQDASDDLQEEDEEEQDEVLGGRNLVSGGFLVPEHHKAKPQPKRPSKRNSDGATLAA